MSAADAATEAPDALDFVAALATMAPGEVPRPALATARNSMLDTLVVMRAGVDEPVSHIVRNLVLAEAGSAAASLAGSATRVPPRGAALANGTTAHALDYDDTHFGHVGHVSVAVLPAALAAGEAVDASAQEVLHAFVLGAEAACRVGAYLGRPHYLAGFHQTATAGAFGACVAAGVVLGLTHGALRGALSLVSTRASGLKSQFGTMGKPFHAGLAASNGVEAAILASAGFVAASDGFGGRQGFVATHAGAADGSVWNVPPAKRFLFEDNQYKLHACCHGTHAMIEALTEIRARHPGAGEARAITVATNPRWLDVCDIKWPQTGLELKFSYGALAGLVLLGGASADPAAFTDDAAQDARIGAIAQHVFVEGDDALSDTEARVALTLSSGETVEAHHDLARPVEPHQRFGQLAVKAETVLGPAAGPLIDAVTSLERRSARDLGALVAG